MTPDLGPSEAPLVPPGPTQTPPPSSGTARPSERPAPADAAPVQSPGSASDEGRVVLTSEDISRALRRMAHEVVERHKGAEGLVILGIPSRGVPLAQRLAANIADIEGVEVPTGSLDVTMYRDDLRTQPTRPTLVQSIPACGIDGRTVVLVDDVLYSGRTIRAALDALSDLGRPSAVRLAVLVDRGHRDLPIRADHVGKNLPTSASERVRVRLADLDDCEEVRIMKGSR